MAQRLDDLEDHRITQRRIGDVELARRHYPLGDGWWTSPLDEFYGVAFRKKIYGSTAELQGDLDAWITSYNEERAHQGRWCFGKSRMQTFLYALPLAKDKMIAA